MIETFSFALLTMGTVFGLTAGLSPGPLLTIVITETLKHDRKEGIKIAIAPLITDIPIILIASFVFSLLSNYNILLGIISILGGLYFCYPGYKTLKTKGLGSDTEEHKPESLKKGITANFLNPNPYVFWITAGIPNAFKAYHTNLMTVVLYFFLFYRMLVGSKIGIALLIERSKKI